MCRCAPLLRAVPYVLLDGAVPKHRRSIMRTVRSKPQMMPFPNRRLRSGKVELATISLLFALGLFIPAVFAAEPATPPAAVEAAGATIPPKCPIQCCHDYGCKEMESQLDCKAMINRRSLCPSSGGSVTCGEKVCYCG